MSNNLKKTIVLIGGGNMGEALIKGLHKTSTIYVIEADAKRAAYLKKNYSLKIAALTEAMKVAEVVIFAVKPQDMLTAIAAINEVRPPSVNPLYISIAAGLTTTFFEKHLGGKPRVVRSMPNMPGLIGEGITGVSKGRLATASDESLAVNILSTIGQVVKVKESQIDAITAVSGSGPAYVFLFVEQWIKAAVKLGFTYDQAKQLVYQTLLGSAHLLMKSEFEAGVLREKVTSKGGTTAAALEVFSKAKFEQIFKTALGAANKRAKQLAK